MFLVQLLNNISYITDDSEIELPCEDQLQVNMFITDVVWIVGDLIVILFKLKKFNISCIKQYENKVIIFFSKFFVSGYN